ncbi:MAG: hypothetical protein AAGA32_02590 [Pseudomonadota bacterium]
MVGARDRPVEIVVTLRQVKGVQGRGIALADAVRLIGGEAVKPPSG